MTNLPPVIVGRHVSTSVAPFELPVPLHVVSVVS